MSFFPAGFDPRSERDRARLRKLSYPPGLRIFCDSYDADGRWDDALAVAAAERMVAAARTTRKRKQAT